MQEVAAPAARSARERFTFRGNLEGTRHGWLRLTPAYSVHLVRELLEGRSAGERVLDPFCGTGTTLLACAERGLSAATVDLNPFLVWLARAKTARYGGADVASGKDVVARMTRAARGSTGEAFVPAIHRIDRWWDAETAAGLGRAAAVLRAAEEPARAVDLARLALCRALIAVANVSFGHQSMSFKKQEAPLPKPRGKRGSSRVALALESAIDVVASAAASALPAEGTLKVHLGDSRDLGAVLGKGAFTAVVTSPPYSNRMSYIRELRPYMYWLGHLRERSDAGELDWRAIGGTWGSATSRLSTWRAGGAAIPHPAFAGIVRRIAEREPLLGSYVHRYFEDMERHVTSLAGVVAPGGTVHYVVGNSKFYDVMLPAEEIFAALFEAAGFTAVRIQNIRKRTSKKELYEFLVEAKQGAPAPAQAASIPKAATPRRRSSRRTSTRPS